VYHCILLCHHCPEEKALKKKKAKVKSSLLSFGDGEDDGA